MGLVGLFRSINRRFEGDLIGDIRARLDYHHGLATDLISVPCHAGRGGNHLCIRASLAPGQQVDFHYCGGMGFSRYLDAGAYQWQEAPWMMAMKNEAATRIASFVVVLRDSLQSLPHYDEQAVVDESEDEDDEVAEGSYEHLVDLMNDTRLATFEPFVAENLGGGAPAKVVCLQMRGDDPAFLLLAKTNKRTGWDGRWKTWWLESDGSGGTTISELAWFITIEKTLTDDQQVYLLLDLLGEFLAEINKMTKVEVLGSDFIDSDEGDPESWELYGDSEGIYGRIADALRYKDFSGRELEVVTSVDGVTEDKAIVFITTHTQPRLVVVYKRNALNWAAAAVIQIGDAYLQKPIPWQLRHTDDADALASEVSSLAHRLMFGDLSDL